jgi:predicted ribosomally synthesized peptide with nif11-like leader
VRLRRQGLDEEDRMSQENVIAFLNRLSRDERLCAAVTADCTTPQAWVAAADAAGHPSSVEHLRAIVEQLVGRPLGEKEVVPALNSLFTSELSDDDMDAVAGGAASTLAARLKGLAVALAAGGGSKSVKTLDIGVPAKPSG